MKKNPFFLFLLYYVSLFSQTNCTDFKLTDFKINGNTTVTTNEATLTLATNNQGGSIWSNQKIDLSKDFTISTELNFGTIDGSGADGIAFILQPLSSDLGGWGGGMGYLGISPSLAIEFDTWYNAGIDPVTEDHIAIIKNGHPDNIPAHSEFIPPIALPNIEDGLWHEAIFEWNATTKKLKVTFDNSVRVDTTIDIVNSIFSGKKEVYWGFTAATGGAVNIHKVKLKNYCVTLETCSNIPEISASTSTVCIGTKVNLKINNNTQSLTQFQLTNPDLILFKSIGSHYYFYKNQATTWPLAKSYGDQIGASLYIINDVNEELLVYNALPSRGNDGIQFWIGLYQDLSASNYSEPSGGWKWVDNSPIQYSNWYTGEPNNTEDSENFGQIEWNVFGMKWNDAGNPSNNSCRCTTAFPIYEIENLANYSYLWSTGETTSSINPKPLVTTTYWVDVTTNGATCRKSITITVKNTPAPTGTGSQLFCDDKSIGDLAVNGIAIIWYPTATSTSEINNNTPLVNGTTYFATQTVDGCESTNRFQTTISIVKVPSPTGDSIQKFCLEENPTISNLIASGTNINWLDSATNGMFLNNTTLLQDNTTYFATSSDTSSGCQSKKPLIINVDLFKCNITPFNLITINGNSLNDQLTFEDISYFPENSIKIYNRYGKLVWETTGYDNTYNAFKGKANVSGLFMKDSFLPAGTYFFILVYHNKLINKQTELTGYLQIDNAN